ncbi:hypothetical protein DH2020_007626 [Rehmannia glutinosa]|uniref:Glucose-6-phosphate isomerase n=1 Tax=Rehmannia glutinosa TaxID=99300 RepID=A0ABR0TYS1_REHGL
MLPTIRCRPAVRISGFHPGDPDSNVKLVAFEFKHWNLNCGIVLGFVQMASSALICETEPWKDLRAHVDDIKKTHLRELMTDMERCQSMMVYDICATLDTLNKLNNLAQAAHLKEKIDRMFEGERINSTENRSVLHVALRAPRNSVINSDGKNVVPDVWQVLDKIKNFSDRVRSGAWVGATGKALKNVIAIGIGGSFLGPLFVNTALQTDLEAAEFARGRQLRCLANVDPIDVARNLAGLDPETTLVVVVSKTFTTAETMLNARTLREWISAALGAVQPTQSAVRLQILACNGPPYLFQNHVQASPGFRPQAVAKHMVAVSTNLTLVEKFGIDPNNAFAFWDWVGGRYSVCSAVGVLPLSLQYGFEVALKLLSFVLSDISIVYPYSVKVPEGASSIDQHFHSAPFEKNLPVLLGLLSVWNVSFLGYPARVSMESNGKGVSIDGVPLPYETGEIDFGEPGTNGQHSFYQLIHQGRIIPCDFIGVVKSQQPVYLKGELVSNHDELMSNFFAQPDALAYGKTPEQLLHENVPHHLITHKTFSGNRPSLSLLLPSLNAYNIGQLLAIYEHRIAVEGFVWGINSFDQWGVELGKSLATQVRKQLHASRRKGEPVEGFNFSTTMLLTRFLELHHRNRKRYPVLFLLEGQDDEISFDQDPHTAADDHNFYSHLSVEELQDMTCLYHKVGTNCSVCAICLENIRHAEVCRVMPACRHEFHAHCIDPWLSKRLTCPTCRTPFRPRLSACE